MMRWWLDRGIDGFRMDVINMLSKDVALPDGVVAERSRYGDGSPYFISGPRIHEFVAEMHREVLAGVRRSPADGRGDAGRDRRAGPPVHRRRTRRARHGVPVRARRPRPARRQVGPRAARPARAQGVVRPLAGGPRRRRVEQPLLEQPRPAAGRVALRRRRRRTACASATALATALHLQRGTPYVYQGEELGHDERRRSRRSATSATSSRCATTPLRSTPGPIRRPCSTRCAWRAVTTPARRCSGTRRPTPASPPASRGSPSTRTTRRSTPPPPSPIPARCSTTTVA